MKNLTLFLIISLMSLSNVAISEVEIEECDNDPNSNAQNIINYTSFNKFECRGRGAWFYKVQQRTPDDTKGISADFKLPTFEHDPKRYFDNPKKYLPTYTTGPLDRGSVYLGGEIGGTELDAGLSWDKVYENGVPKTVPEFDKNGRIITETIIENGNPKIVIKQKEVFAFRPFWRATEKLNSKTVWHNPDIYSESVRNDINLKTETKLMGEMNETDKKKYLVEKKEKEDRDKIVKKACDLSQTDEEKKNSCNKQNASFETPGTSMSMKLEQIGNFPDKRKHGNRYIIKMKISDGNKCFVTCFEHLGKPKENKNSWKRVSSIDQFSTSPCYIDKKGNITSDETDKKVNGSIKGDCRPSRESQKANVVKTNAKLKNMVWKKVTLLKEKNKSVILGSMNSEKILGKEFCGGTNLNKANHFITTDINNESGGQTIQIIP